MTRDQEIYRVVNLKIPKQFLPSNYQAEDGQPEKPVKADDTAAAVQESISMLVGVKIPAMNTIKSSEPIPVQTDIVNVDVKPSKPDIRDNIDGQNAQPIPVPINIENVDVKPSEADVIDDIERQTETVQENISNLVGIKIPTIQNIISVPNNVESVKPSEADMTPEAEFSAMMPEEDGPSDKIEPQAPPTTIGDNKNSGGEDVKDVDINAPDVVVPGKDDTPDEDNEIFIDISAIVNVKIPTLPPIRNVPDSINQEDISITKTEATGGFKCINGITISIDQVCVLIV